jgi:uncharacterized protein with PIN domain
VATSSVAAASERSVPVVARQAAAAAGRRSKEPSERLVLALLARMPAEQRHSFSAAQVAALRSAARELGHGRHPVDFELSLPLGRCRLYARLVAGRERRRG